MNRSPKNCFLGLDLSTQSLTAVVIEPAGGDLHRHAIHFDSCYPSYQTTGGVMIGADPALVHADPRMWIEALDDMLIWLKAKGITQSIRGIAVSAQQHGSVYLNRKAPSALSRLDPSKRLLPQLKQIFSRDTSPIWMDSSTQAECLEITESLGGDQAVARLTGSIATERFAGPQIRKFWKEQPAAYQNTCHIALISSFITSLLIGRLAPLDAGDGFGTNLADIHAGCWSEIAMAASAPGLENRLPPLLVGDKVVGKLSSCLVAAYGFSPQTEVIVGSGDNPCSLVGLGLIGAPETRAISLGTSDTYFGYTGGLKDVQRSSGHIFGTADGRYMFLICFKNGSLARETVKDRYGLSWDDFSDILLQTPPGNNGRIMLPYFLPEITPRVLEPRVLRFGGLLEDDVNANVRAIAEAQVMAIFNHSNWTGRHPRSIIVTAGGSENRGLLKVIAQVFGTEVRSLEVKESAALGAALRAAHCCMNRNKKTVSWSDLTDAVVGSQSVETFRPAADEVQIYQTENGLLGVYEACEKFALGRGEHPRKKIDAFKEWIRS